MSSEIVRRDDDAAEPIKKDSILDLANRIWAEETIIRFENEPLIMTYEKFPHYVPMSQHRFLDAAYPIVSAQSTTKLKDVYQYMSHQSPDHTEMGRYILFGRYDLNDQGETYNHPAAVTTVWDMERLETDMSIPPSSCVWRCPYGKINRLNKGPLKFIMDLACGDPMVYDDIMQSIAPMVMTKKPDGVCWWVGDGANGKSTLMNALYMLFPGQLASVNVQSIAKGDDAPRLNGHLANIVRESSEGRIEATENYKSIGTHEDFTVHKFYSQGGAPIKANMHHIFSANQIPVFNDKGHSARRRTHIIPFNATFSSDPDFEKKTFTPEFLGELAQEICKYAVKLKRQHFKYKFGSTTADVKKDYEDTVNTAEGYFRAIKKRGVVAFDNYRLLRSDYENWCAETGVLELGRNHVTAAAKRAGFTVTRTRMGEKSEIYKLPVAVVADLQPLGGFRLGMYTMPGFAPDEPDPEPVIPPFHEPKEPETVPPGDDPPKVFRKGEW